MERGIRQGDSLSPFLFIIAAEVLNVALDMAKQIGAFEGIQLPRQGRTISHLQYADGVIFLGSWSIENAKNLIKILRCFELSSGLKENLSKVSYLALVSQTAIWICWPDIAIVPLEPFLSYILDYRLELLWLECRIGILSSREILGEIIKIESLYIIFWWPSNTL
uniref:Reverse transcriptase domain-containing protein n=1 Tax=Lactuca sativa TaxID=4236 RepID=A0A9R1XS59_LACSA|nr:hypothetical protein LSAT_V11C300117800 [Lactuca sativa]